MIGKERRVKALVASLLVVAVAVIYWNAAALSTMSMWGVPNALVAALAVAAIAWDLAGIITRHHSILRMEKFLPAIVGSFGIGADLFGRLAMTGKPGFWVGGIRDALEIPWTFSVPFLIAGLMLHLVMRWFLDWREEAQLRLRPAS
jgi:hypothetical protein